MNKSRQERKKELICAAKEIINEQGYEKLTVRTLCERVGVVPSAFYYIFESRDALIMAIADELDEHCLEMAQSILEIEPLSAVEAFCIAYLRFVSSVGVECCRQMHACRRENPQEYERSRVRGATKILWEILERGVAGGCFVREDSGLLFDWVMLFLRGQTHDWVRYGGSYDLETEGRRKLPLLIRMLRA